MSDIDPTELTVVTRRPTQEKFSPDAAEAPASTRGEREGLPAGYRMRADAHYVDQLTSRRADKNERESGRTSATGDMADTHETDTRERRADRLFVELQEQMATITSASAMLTSETSPIARRLALDLVRSQAFRAAWLLRAQALADGRERTQLRPRPLGAILEQIRQGLAPECRLAGVTLQLHANDWNATIMADESVLATGICGAVFATLALVGPAEAVTIRVSVDLTGSDLRSIEVMQEDVAVLPTAGIRFFDHTWTDRPGGWSAGLAALAVRSAAQQHGGSAVLLVGERRGSTVRLNLARTH